MRSNPSTRRDPARPGSGSRPRPGPIASAGVGAGVRIALTALITSLAMVPALAQPEDESSREEVLRAVIESQVSRSSSGSGASSPAVLRGVDLRRASAATRRAARVLRRRRVDVQLERSTVAETLEVLRAVTGLNFVLTPRARKQLEREPRTLTLHLRSLPARNVLNLISTRLGEYRFRLRYGVVHLALRDEMRPRRRLRVYDVRDLVRRRPDFPAPRLGLGENEGR